MGERFIVMAGTAGAKTAFEPEMQRYMDCFPAFFQRKKADLLAEEEQLKALDITALPVSFCERLGEKSVFMGLWDMHKALGRGIKAELEKIPYDQLTVELLEKADKSPYEEPAGNAFLLVTESPFEVLSQIEQKGIRCSIIGTLTPDNACVVVSEAGTRYITPERK